MSFRCCSAFNRASRSARRRAKLTLTTCALGASRSRPAARAQSRSRAPRPQASASRKLVLIAAMSVLLCDAVSRFRATSRQTSASDAAELPAQRQLLRVLWVVQVAEPARPGLGSAAPPAGLASRTSSRRRSRETQGGEIRRLGSRELLTSRLAHLEGGFGHRSSLVCRFTARLG